MADTTDWKVFESAGDGASAHRPHKAPEAQEARSARHLGSAIGGLLLVSFLGGCAGGGGGDGFDDGVIDGLRPARIDAPGKLLIRDEHRIGSYDAFLIPEATIVYDRASRQLPDEMELEFLAALEQSLIYAAQEARIPIVKTPGPCVMQVGMGLINVRVQRGSSRVLGTMTLVMEFRDTETGTPLLRYGTQNEIENDRSGTPRSEQFRMAFDDMVAEMEISRALRAAGLGDDALRPGCKGLLAERGRAAALPAVSAK